MSTSNQPVAIIISDPVYKIMPAAEVTVAELLREFEAAAKIQNTRA